ncbi:MAG: hypothetical protein GX127_08445 [Eubacteriaceae bacterium]|jgi:hypothetical protein|nr:hypothetical protein [Eubacteriaceae bacterium]
MKHTSYNKTYVISGDVKYTTMSQLLRSEKFNQLLYDFVEELRKRRSRKLRAIHPFVDDEGQFDAEMFKDFLILLNVKSLKDIIEAEYFNIHEDCHRYASVLKEFLERLYNYWRSMDRFMVKNEVYVEEHHAQRSKAHSLAGNNESFRKLIIEMYRNILNNVTTEPTKIYRQLPAGAQVAFMVDHFEYPENIRCANESLYRIPVVWQAIFEPPVIFYTGANKRIGVFPVKDKPVLESFYLSKECWYAIPIKVGLQIMVAYVREEFLELGAGLFNLFELATPNEFLDRKPDGVVFFGLDSNLFEEDESRGFVTKEDGVYYGLLPNTTEIDYFGYMKKMLLTLHNLIQIDQKKLPVHGAFARVFMVNEDKVANIMLVGDSGAGKSETLEAMNKLPKDTHVEVDVIIDDMGSLHFDESGNLMALGTEIGAFVRLDDLQPGYAYSTMDRSIFMNPNLVNARVIVPQMTYESISTLTPVHFLFYINNYEKVEEGKPALEFFENMDEAVKVFSEGKRMAKGTTGESGFTQTYFANPFGAVQKKEEHEKIAEEFFREMKESHMPVGMIRTQLGISGYEQQGPLEAAAALVDFISTLENAPSSSNGTKD